MTSGVWLRRLLWAVCTLLLMSVSEASTRTLTIAFAGGGHTGSASIDCLEPSPPHARLSRSTTVTRTRPADRVLRIADAGHLPDLLTAEDAGASAWHLPPFHAWKSHGEAGRRTHRPAHRGQRTVKTPARQGMDDGAPVDDAGEDLSSVEPSRESTTTRDPMTAEVPAVCTIPAPHPDAALVPPPPLDPSTPRAPPA